MDPAIFDLPNELWLETFTSLPRQPLASVHAVCSRFYTLSHSVFFRELILDPTRHPTLTDANFAELLPLYTAPHIAHHVQTLSVSLKCQREPPRDSTEYYVLVYLPLLKSVFRFSNLRILELVFDQDSEVELAHLGLETLPALEELRIKGGALYVPAQVPMTKLRVAHFTYVDIPGGRMLGPRPDNKGHPFVSTSDLHRAPERSFLAMLDPAALYSITLRPSYDCPPGAWLRKDQDLWTTFTALRAVNIQCDGPFLEDVVHFVRSLPALEELTMSGQLRRTTPPSLTSAGLEPLSPLMNLKAYTGPCEYLPFFLPPLATCARIAITCACFPSQIFTSLNPLSKATPAWATEVTDLALVLPLGVIHRTTWTLQSEWLRAHFSHLARLRIRVSDNPLDDEDKMGAFMLDKIGSGLITLPYALDALINAAARQSPTLEHTVVEWDVSEDTAAHEVFPDLESLRDELVGEGEEVTFFGRIRRE